jgi:hypothetical protein
MFEARHVVWRRFAFLLGGVLLCLLLGAGSSGAQTQGSKHSDAVTCTLVGSHVSSPSTGVAALGISLNAIDALSPNDIWAVGSYHDSFGTQQSVTIHWDGTSWRVIFPYFTTNPSYLTGVSAVAPNEVWAVGHNVDSENPRLVIRWDGTMWRHVPMPRWGDFTDILAFSSSNVWVVGGSDTGYSARPVIEHWNGIQWTRHFVPGLTYALFTAIDGNSPGDIWVVGREGMARTVTARWSGQAWTRVPSPNPALGYGGAEHNVINDVEVISANDVWAVGYSGIDDGYGQYNTMTLHWDSTAWRIVPSPNHPSWSHNYLSGVSAVSSNEVWAVGWCRSLYSGPCSPRTYRWNGTAWIDVGSPETIDAVEALTSNNVWGVGRNLHRWEGSAWRVLPSPPVTHSVSELRYVSVYTQDWAWAVGHSEYFTNGSRGDAALIQLWNSSTGRWQAEPMAYQSRNERLRGVVALSSDNAWAVGGHGSAPERALYIRRNGTQWVWAQGPPNLPIYSSLNGIAAASPSNIWAVGSQGVYGAMRPLITRWNGSAWSIVEHPVPTGTDVTLYAVSALSPTDVWAVGVADGRSLTMHYDGAAWSVFPSPNPHPTSRNILRGVAARASDDVWAVGYSGPPGSGDPLIIRWNGSQWSRTDVPAVGSDTFLLDVETGSSGDVWAVGNYLSGGVQRPLVMRWDGTAWQNVNSPNPANGPAILFALDSTPAGELWMVGSAAQGADTRTLTLRYSPPPAQYTDVSVTDTFYPYIQCLACRNIDTGYACGGPNEPCDARSNPYFRPNSLITRQEIARMVAAAADFGEDPGPQRFHDVPATNPYYDWINRMYARGLIGGYPCGGPGEPCGQGNLPYFRPHNRATRGQIAKIVSNGAGFSDPVSGQFYEDVPPSNPFYEWVQRLTSRQIMGGYGCGGPNEPCVPPHNRPYFRWYNDATRGQTSKITANTFFPSCTP